MLAVIFESWLKLELKSEYSQIADRITKLAQRSPGLISFSSVRMENGKGITVAIFKDRESLLIWKNNPEHLQAQKLGKSKFYVRYSIKICTLDSQRDWPTTDEF